MPPINDFKCDKCGFLLPSGWGGYLYVTDQTGRRIICPHPCEFETIIEVLGENAPQELIDEKTGFNSDCLCLDCLKDSLIDLKRDTRACVHCNSTRIASLRELVGQPCPKCKDGTIQEIETGLWS